MIERYKRQTVLWLFEDVQASFAEIAAVLATTREEVERLYQEAKAERYRLKPIDDEHILCRACDGYGVRERYKGDAEPVKCETCNGDGSISTREATRRILADPKYRLDK